MVLADDLISPTSGFPLSRESSFRGGRIESTEFSPVFGVLITRDSFTFLANVSSSFFCPFGLLELLVSGSGSFFLAIIMVFAGVLSRFPSTSFSFAILSIRSCSASLSLIWRELSFIASGSSSNLSPDKNGTASMINAIETKNRAIMTISAILKPIGPWRLERNDPNTPPFWYIRSSAPKPESTNKTEPTIFIGLKSSSRSLKKMNARRPNSIASSQYPIPSKYETFSNTHAPNVPPPPNPAAMKNIEITPHVRDTMKFQTSSET